MIISLDLGSGSSGDGVYLMDDQGCVVDAVVYGGSNSDEIPDESGEPAESVADKPGDDESLARISDGWDSNRSGEDFVISDAPTPGSANPVVTAPVCDTSGRTGLRLNGPAEPRRLRQRLRVAGDRQRGLGCSTGRLDDRGGDPRRSWSEDFVFPDGVGLDGGSFVVVGGEEVDSLIRGRGPLHGQRQRRRRCSPGRL